MKITCPECHKGLINPLCIPNHEAKIGGVKYIIKDASVAKCDKCGFLAVTAEELKRWREHGHRHRGK